MDLFDLCINDERQFYEFAILEDARKQLKLNQSKIQLNDLGAGSTFHNVKEKAISQIAHQALSFPYQCRLLFRLVDFLQPEKVLELGTSLGVSTAYLAKANKGTKVITIEGDQNVYKIANKLFSLLGLNNIETHNENFDIILPKILKNHPTIDLAFIDGNHSKEATLNYFQLIKENINPNSVLIFDDIYWSTDMEEAWKQIKEDNIVRSTIDLFMCGIVLFREDLPVKNHYKIKPGKLMFHK